MILKNIPNALTMTRLLLIIPFLWFFYQKQYNYAFDLFIFAGLTDALDGWLARYFHWQSAFGSLIDPIADKLLITSSVLALAWQHQIPWWFVILVFLRDVTISGGVLAWYGLVRCPLEFNPTYLSKINTALQLAFVTCNLYCLAHASPHHAWITWLLELTTFTTLSSFIHYVWTWGHKAYDHTHATS